MNIAIYTNILTPYRKYFYDKLYEECKRNGDEFHVLLMAETEEGRNWTYDQFKTEYTILLNHKTVMIGSAPIHFNNNLKDVLKKLDLDILICAGGYLCPGVWDVLRWKKQFKYKTYFWSESHLNESRDYSGLKVKLRETIRKKVYRSFDGFWYAGKLSRELIERYASVDSDMYFMPNLVEEQRYYSAANISAEERNVLREKYHIDDKKTVFICPARLISVKGIDKFIPLLANMPDKDKITILIAGDGELKEKVAASAKELNIAVRLLGFQNQEAIVELYSIADAFLLPSLSDANPLTCIEALWAGLPLFISNHCGNYPEVVKPEENGYVFNYTNKKEAIDNLTKIINSSNQWRTNAKKVSLEIAKDKYDSEKVVHNVIQYFHGIIGKN